MNSLNDHFVTHRQVVKRLLKRIVRRNTPRRKLVITNCMVNSTNNGEIENLDDKAVAITS